MKRPVRSVLVTGGVLATLCALPSSDALRLTLRCAASGPPPLPLPTTSTSTSSTAAPVPLSRRRLLQRGASIAAAGVLTGDSLRGLTSTEGGVLLPASVSAAVPASSLPEEAYTTLGKSGLRSCRVLNGMWQLSGAHGFRPKVGPALAAMGKLGEEGLTTFDLADHYGPAEDFVGAFRAERPNTAQKAQFFTKWVPRPGQMPKEVVEAAVDRSVSKMGGAPLDMLQFHWWDYNAPQYMDALRHLSELKEGGKIKEVSLTNFDSDHVERITDKGIALASNQVQYSLIDQRPGQKMAQVCDERGVKLLCYGVLLGGFLSDKWVGLPDPASSGSMETVSQKKYYNMIRYWGSWEKFQELLSVCKEVASKHGVSIAQVGTRWVLQQKAVGGAIIGQRLGYTEHVADTKRVFDFQLDRQDLESLAEASRGRDLMRIIGDCGDEYRA